jgi:hypothetical protein
VPKRLGALGDIVEGTEVEVKWQKRKLAERSHEVVTVEHVSKCILSSRIMVHLLLETVIVGHGVSPRADVLGCNH